MNVKVRRPYLYLMLATVLLAGMLFFMHESNLFALNRVEVVKGAEMVDTLIFGDSYGTNLFDLRLGEYADSLLKHKQVLKVDLDYGIPDRVKIAVNDFDPIAVALYDGKMYGLNSKGFVLPYEPNEEGILLPVITGTEKLRIYEKITDDELMLLLENLERIFEEEQESYRSLANIVITDSGCVSLFIEGVNPEIISYPGSLAENVLNIEAFLSDYDPDLSQVKYLDLRSEGLIVAVND